MPNCSREFELKLELSENQLPNVAAIAVSKPLAAGKPRRQKLRSIYYDTPKHALRCAGISLRLRQVDSNWVQTVKLETRVQGGISNPMEIETPVPGNAPRLDRIPSGSVRRKLRKLTDRKSLEPIFRTDVVRTTHRLKLAGTKAELALDSGRVRTSTQSAAICEAELELKSGSAERLHDIGQHLFAGTPFRFGSQSKAERGYRLAEQNQSPGLAPVNAQKAGLHPSDSAPVAFASLCQSTVNQVLGNWNGLLDEDDPEFAHQMRVGLRRLRTTIQIFRPAIDNQTMRKLRRDLGRLGRRVGELRDADVLLEDIAQPILQSSALQDGSDELEQLLQNHGDTVRAMLREEFRRTGWNTLLLQLALLPHGAGWSNSIKESGKVSRFARKALKKSWQSVSEMAQDLKQLSIEDRHTLRKELKTLRYATEFFAPLLPARKCRKFIGRLKILQDSFGYLNDVALAQTLPEIVARAPNQSPQLHRAVEYLLDCHGRRADGVWKDTRRQWRQLKKQPKPWK